MGTDNYYSVKEDVQKYIDGCKTKMNVRTHKVFGRAVLAGMMIAFGASASNVAAPAVTTGGRMCIPGWTDDGCSSRCRTVYRRLPDGNGKCRRSLHHIGFD